MDKLFDIFNSSQINYDKDSRCAITETNGQIDRLNEMQSWISSLEIMDMKRSLPCIFSWQLNTESLKCLWEDVHNTYQLKNLMTNRLNQDSLENLFSTLRNAVGNSDTPTCQLFKKIINGKMSNNILQQSVKGNCLNDTMPILQ